MPGYLVHRACCTPETLNNRSFELGIELVDMLKKNFKTYGPLIAESKYDFMRTEDMPEYEILAERIQQKEVKGQTTGLHYGVSSSPDVWACWEDLAECQKNEPFWRGYIWHLLCDYLIYKRLDIDAKTMKAFIARGDMDEKQAKANIINTLHADWDKTNAKVMETYPDLRLTPEVKELNVVKFIKEGEITFVDWTILKTTIDYLRGFDPLHDNMEEIIREILK